MEGAEGPGASGRRTGPRRPGAILVAALAVVLVAAACGSPAEGGPAGELRLGYLPNLTHAVAVAGIEREIFEEALGGTRLVPLSFNAGPAAVEALFSGALDASYLGPNPVVNAFVQSKGQAVRVIAGAAAGGAAFVVRRSVAGPADLRGRTVASPQLGGTQDVALRYWLQRHGLRTDPGGGGDVKVVPQENAQSLEAFRSGEIEGAWVPEPWVTRLVREGGGKVLVDERDLWPEGRFATTLLVVRTEFLRRHPDVVRRLLRGHLLATRFVTGDTDAAMSAVNAGLARITGKRLPAPVMSAAWRNLTFTTDPVADSLVAAGEHAEAVGLLRGVELDGLFDLTLLREVLRDNDDREVHR